MRAVSSSPALLLIVTFCVYAFLIWGLYDWGHYWEKQTLKDATADAVQACLHVGGRPQWGWNGQGLVGCRK